jgi:hypothetical protein
MVSGRAAAVLAKAAYFFTGQAHGEAERAESLALIEMLSRPPLN